MVMETISEEQGILTNSCSLTNTATQKTMLSRRRKNVIFDVDGLRQKNGRKAACDFRCCVVLTVVVFVVVVFRRVICGLAVSRPSRWPRGLRVSPPCETTCTHTHTPGYLTHHTACVQTQRRQHRDIRYKDGIRRI